MTIRLCQTICIASFLLPQAWGQPTISANGVVNATGYQAKIAPDTVFVIFGNGMGPQSIATASAPNYSPSLAGMCAGAAGP